MEAIVKSPEEATTTLLEMGPEAVKRDRQAGDLRTSTHLPFNEKTAVP
jgi:hypothetical protein